MADQNQEKDRFHIVYHIKHHEEGITQEEIPPGYGATDCILIMSRLITDDGKEDYAFLSVDGVTGKSLSAEEVFKAWVILANMLKDNLPEGDIRQDLCADVLNIVYHTMDKPEQKIEKAPPRILVPGSKTFN